MTSPAKEKALQERMARLSISDADLIESFTAGSGPGGQKINKTANCVQLTHPTTGIEIQCQDSRSRSMNRYLARLRLCEKIEAQRETQRQERDRVRARERFKKRRRSLGEKRRVRKFKSWRTNRKGFRKGVSGSDD